MNEVICNYEKVLKRLKDFQRRTAEYVFRRFYTDTNPTDRFLVADEVGLGKTLVAKGLIALAIEHLHQVKKIERIDIVYICSNISIASQNIDRLNVTGIQEFVRPTRLSLLPMHIVGIRKNRVNYIGLTPGTSFDPQSREGMVEERALIYHVLKGKLELKRSGLRHLLRGRVGKDNWRRWTRQWPHENIDSVAGTDFIQSIKSNEELYSRLKEFCNLSPRDIWRNDERLRLISELRCLVAEVSVKMLEPDLIILDEFQRFKKLLDKNNPEARLAQKLFQYAGVKTLLLSATPYKMLSLDHEQDDDHYPDFLKTLRFLFNSDGPVEEVKKEILNFRRSLFLMNSDNTTDVSAARNSLQSKLLHVMCRTERVGITQKQDAMLMEAEEKPAISTCDLHDVVLADKVAACVGANDIIEYWKSSPYLVNFLRRYEFRRKLEDQCANASEELLSVFSNHGHRLLHKSEIYKYGKINPANSRMRYLFSKTIDKGLWKILWLPPSMPYSQPEGPFAEIKDATKYLVFSAWNVVPDSIAALCSYEAERRMLSSFPKTINYPDLHKEIPQLLRYNKSTDGRMAGMSALVLFYPSPALASLVDPLGIALKHSEEGLIKSTTLVERVAEILKPYINSLLTGVPDSGPEDQRWYWALPAMLDGGQYPAVSDWLSNQKTGWLSLSEKSSQERGEYFKDHLDLLRQATEKNISPSLGKPPADLIQIVARMAIAAPGICSLRSLHRQASSINGDSFELLNAAAQIADGFKTLFNLPDSIALLRGGDPDTFYWRHVLLHCLQGNIQALLDEQCHCLVESLGVFDEKDEERVSKIGISLASSLSLRTAPLQVDDVIPRLDTRKVDFEGYNIRCRFALRFGELKDEQGDVKRAETVRDAFNSPFRPFILASTSVGQEGLDFHTWCHAVVHWNLPSNPVDLEQREGRIHRYKGHAIRKNVAIAYGLNMLREKWNKQGDPWQCIFTQARQDRANDLLTYWLFEPSENGVKIERHIPIMNYSREEAHFSRLKKMLVIYRLVFGQPRQEDLLKYLTEQMDVKEDYDVNNWRISLAPPAV